MRILSAQFDHSSSDEEEDDDEDQCLAGYSQPLDDVSLKSKNLDISKRQEDHQEWDKILAKLEKKSPDVKDKGKRKADS